MDIRRYIAATCFVFVFVLLYQFLVDSYLLVGMYIETSKVWRDFGEMLSNIPLTMCFMFILSAWSSFVFTRIFKEGGMANGLRFGLYFGVFAGILSASWYLWVPVPAKLALGWMVTRFIQVLGAGFILGLVLRKQENAEVSNVS